MVVKHILRWVFSPQIFVVGIVAALVLGGMTLTSPPKTSVSTAAHKQQVLASKTPIKRPDCSVQACIALTFDDGPDPVITPQVLDILKRHNARSTFFVLGYHVQGNEKILKQIHEEGHEIGNHSWGHSRFTQLTSDQIQNEINNTQEVIAKAGVPVPHLFRPPYGDINQAILEQIPLTVVRWNIDRVTVA
jgi:peptidoglycan/xylan/chitin deacetylase (PgdA/CDA1 family)